MNTIEILSMGEDEYRGAKYPSYSLLKTMDAIGPRAINQKSKVYGEAVDFGSLVDCLLLTPEELDHKFYCKPIEIPTGQLLELADYIIEKIINGEVSIDDISSDKKLELVVNYSSDLNLFGSIKDSDKKIAKFNTDLFWNYINNKIESNGKIVVSPNTYNDAIDAVSILKSHTNTVNLFTVAYGIEDINQLKLLISIDGKEVKLMADRIRIDHNTKTIYPYDLKCTDFPQDMFPYNFKKQKYYLQASEYSVGIIGWAKKLYPDYVVDNFRFIVYSRLEKFPFIWKVSDDFLAKGLSGYETENGRKIKGITQLLDDYYYYINTENFTTRREFIENEEIELI